MIHTIDLELMGSEGVVAAYFIPTKAGHLVVDCGPSSTLPKLRSGIEALGYDFSEVRHLLLTHIHLDHAGAAGTLAHELGLQVYVHQHGAGHLERPERLLESATRIYGSMMDTLWGKFEAVPKHQLVVLEGGEHLKFDLLEFEALYTPGHAVHHLSYLQGGNLFSGDVGGIHLQGTNHVVAPTPPPDIDFALWRKSLALLKTKQIERVFPTHFGKHDDVQNHFDRLEQSIVQLEALTQTVLGSGGDSKDLAAAIKQQAAEQLSNRALEKRYELSTPHEMAASGLARYWKKQQV